MKNKVIRIKDVSEIDTSRATVYDLNNRYIDSVGNLYGLRYDRFQRKVEVIKLFRTHISEAQKMQQQIYVNKAGKSSRSTSEDRVPPNSEFDYGAESGFETVSVEEFIGATVEQMAVHKDRLRGIMMNITNSNAFPRENKSDVAELDNIFRDLEIEGVQRFEELDSYYKELVNYPRSISYYSGRLDKKARDVLENLSGKSDKAMAFIRNYEMCSMFEELYLKVLVLVKKLHEEIARKESAGAASSQQFNAKAFEDALISINNTESEIEAILEKIAFYKNFLVEQ